MIEDAKIYTSSFYERAKSRSRISADAVVPFVMNWIAPTTVIDLGCGTGEWLAVFKEAGVREIHGVDGAWVLQDQLAIPQQAFTEQDLKIPYVAGRHYDLAMSLEAAEHLPPETSGLFVQSLTDLAPVVLFSAAIPDQAGKHHVNCQWPAYWAELFAQRGYVVVDALRPRIWEDSSVLWWYRQNMMIYVHEEQLKRLPELEALRHGQPPRPLPLVHPEMLKGILEWGLEEHTKYMALYLDEKGLRCDEQSGVLGSGFPSRPLQTI